MDELGQHSSRSSVYLIIISFSLTAVFIAIYHLITKIYRRRRGAAPQFPEFSRPASGDGLTVLAEASTVQLIAPAIIFKKGDAVGGEDGGVGYGGAGGGGGGRVGGIGEERTCPVCLSEFEEGDAVRVLPECRHCFHVECIDLWFRSHSTCPVCRSESLAV